LKNCGLEATTGDDGAGRAEEAANPAVIDYSFDDQRAADRHNQGLPQDVAAASDEDERDRLEERAAILEYDAGAPRQWAKAKAWFDEMRQPRDM
jgi:hypothetical protein